MSKIKSYSEWEDNACDSCINYDDCTNIGLQFSECAWSACEAQYLEEIKAFQSAFANYLNCTDGKPISAHDVNLILISLKDMQSKKSEGLEKTAPDTYLRMKHRIDEKDKEITELKAQLEKMKCSQNCGSQKVDTCKVTGDKEMCRTARDTARPW
jgi:hypothetical protein